MSNDYLWDRSGTPDPDTKQLEELLGPLAHDAPLDELRLAKGRRSEPVRATANESVVAPAASGRAKGKMNFFDKRIIGVATLTTAALGLLGVAAYRRHVNKPAPQVDPFQDGPALALVASYAMTPHASPVAPTTGADLAITAGESARIHVPFGAVDVEIQSKCNAEVEMSVVTAAIQVQRNPNAPVMLVPVPPSESHAIGGDPIIAGTDSPDGRASTYHLMPDMGPASMVQYTSRCAGQPPMHGVLEIDRDNALGPIALSTNARVFDNGSVTMATLAHGFHMFGTVLPGANVSIGGKSLPLGPPDATGSDPPIYPTFATDIPLSGDHLVAALRVDDAMGTHFYVAHPALLVEQCAATITAPKQTAAKLDAQGDHAGALKTLKTAITACAPDRDTFSLALSYACKAGDTEAARKYWRKLPPELQRTLEPLCAQNGITRDQLVMSHPDVDFQKIIEDPKLTNEQKNEILKKLLP